MCSRQHMQPVATICRSIFNRPPKRNADGHYVINLPFGMDVGFVPYAGDKWDVTPTASRQHTIHRARENQRAFILNSFEGIVGYLKSRNFNYFLVILDRSIDRVSLFVAIVYLIQL